MEIFDVAVIGGGPAGSVCAAFCATSGLSVVLIEREKFPREKVCGDCLNPECWPILRRLGIDQRVRVLPHGALDGWNLSMFVTFISGSTCRVGKTLRSRSNAAR